MPVGTDGQCQATGAVQRLAGRWKAPVLDALRHRPSGFLALGRAVPGVSHRMLARTLRELEADLLIDRSDPSGPLGRVAYTLTDAGRRALAWLDSGPAPTQAPS